MAHFLFPKAVVGPCRDPGSVVWVALMVHGFLGAYLFATLDTLWAARRSPLTAFGPIDVSKTPNNLKPLSGTHRTPCGNPRFFECRLARSAPFRPRSLPMIHLIPPSPAEGMTTPEGIDIQHCILSKELMLLIGERDPRDTSGYLRFLRILGSLR